MMVAWAKAGDQKGPSRRGARAELEELPAVRKLQCPTQDLAAAYHDSVFFMARGTASRAP